MDHTLLIKGCYSRPWMRLLELKAHSTAALSRKLLKITGCCYRCRDTIINDQRLLSGKEFTGDSCYFEISEPGDRKLMM